MYCGIHKLNGIGVRMPENLISEDALPDTGTGAEKRTSSLWGVEGTPFGKTVS